MTDKLFIESDNLYDNICILLIDASGSVTNIYNDNIIIFDKIKEIISELPEQEYHVIYWNSDKNNQYPFHDGIFKLPFIVKKSTLDQGFMYIKTYINTHCLTYPHLAFRAIEDSWIKKDSYTKIYFITDGEIGYYNISYSDQLYLKKCLGDSIKNLFNKYNNIQLNIITIEPHFRDFTQSESIQHAAGCDVYNVIMNNHLTECVSKFISYTPNNKNGFIHINKNKPPPGYIPFGEKYFSELKINEFISYVGNLIANTKEEDKLLQIVQYLSSSLTYIIKDKPIRIIDDIITIFCNFFNNTPLDKMLVRFILSDSINKEKMGMANIFAEYRAQLKDLYKRANELLETDVKNSIGIGELFLTLPLDNKIVSGHRNFIDQTIKNYNKQYPRGGVIIDDVTIPVIPFNYDNLSPMEEQCLRQWIRLIVHKMFKVDIMGDVILFIVLSFILQVVISDINDDIKKNYQMLGFIMFKKKRANTDITELEKILKGELPLSNIGKTEQFEIDMNFINRIFNTHFSPLTIWYALCVSLGNQEICNNQILHCKTSINSDFPGLEPSNILNEFKKFMKPIEYYSIGFEKALDYNCLITLEDTSLTGGYRFLPHISSSRILCNPIYILSSSGYDKLIKEENTCICPICYSKLTKNNFETIGPKQNTESTIIFSPNEAMIFRIIGNTSNTKIEKKELNISFSPPNNDILVINKLGTLIIMKGTVGSGKSTFAHNIKEKINSLGGICFIIGMDKYSKDGIFGHVAIDAIKKELSVINDMDIENNQLLVVIIDTCGEKNTGDTIFNVSFKKWKKMNIWPNLYRGNMAGYLAWSLRNVIIRTLPKTEDYYYLNPESAGLNTCISVHQKKTIALYGKKIPKFNFNQFLTKEEIIAQISEAANNYQQYLDNNMQLEEQINSFIKKLIN